VQEIKFTHFNIHIDENNFVTVKYPGEDEATRTKYCKQFPKHWTTKQIVYSIVLLAQVALPDAEVKANWPN
jgi:hypothetical protein